VDQIYIDGAQHGGIVGSLQVLFCSSSPANRKQTAGRARAKLDSSRGERELSYSSDASSRRERGRRCIRVRRAVFAGSRAIGSGAEASAGKARAGRARALDAVGVVRFSGEVAPSRSKCTPVKSRF